MCVPRSQQQGENPQFHSFCGALHTQSTSVAKDSAIHPEWKDSPRCVQRHLGKATGGRNLLAAWQAQSIGSTTRLLYVLAAQTGGRSLAEP